MATSESVAHRTTATICPVCRMRLASVNRELRQWSAAHGNELWDHVELKLWGGDVAERWAGPKWLQKHISNVWELSLVIHRVSSPDLHSLES